MLKKVLLFCLLPVAILAGVGMLVFRRVRRYV